MSSYLYIHISLDRNLKPNDFLQTALIKTCKSISYRVQNWCYPSVKFPLHVLIQIYWCVCIDTYVFYQSVLEKKTYESQIWSVCIAKRCNVVTSWHRVIVMSDTSGLYDYPFNISGWLIAVHCNICCTALFEKKNIPV